MRLGICKPHNKVKTDQENMQGALNRGDEGVAWVQKVLSRKERPADAWRFRRANPSLAIPNRFAHHTHYTHTHTRTSHINILFSSVCSASECECSSVLEPGLAMVPSSSNVPVSRKQPGPPWEHQKQMPGPQPWAGQLDQESVACLEG